MGHNNSIPHALECMKKPGNCSNSTPNNRLQSAEAHQPGHGTAVNEYRLTGFIQ